ncbi:MAG: AAA family ATPase [Desulfobacterales bacterium]|nr:AAA family ATPase [Desulfobacterales bacterium]
MILHNIELVDFRQFKGRQAIDCATGSPHNVSVIYGENGRGKTGIFRALMFCLYGDRSLSQDELSGEQKKEGLSLINEVTLKENIGSQVEAQVAISFSHQRKNFRIVRRVDGLMKTDGTIIQNPGGRVELQQTDENGNTQPVETDLEKITGQIQEILNSRLRDYFLFDGERIERLTRNTRERREEVRRGIRALLDLDALELANAGLKSLISQIEKEIGHKSTGELQRVYTHIDALNTKIDDLENAQELGTQELKRLEHKIYEISEMVSENEDTAAKERKRQELIKNSQDLKVEKDALKKEMVGYLNKSAQLVASQLIEQLREELEFRRHKGELPPSIRKEFVEKLLEQERCICGTSLGHDHQQERECLQEFLVKHYTPGLGSESLDLLLSLNRLSSANEGLANQFNRLLVKNKKLRDEIADLESKIKLLSDELKEGGTSVDDLIQERSRLEDDKRTLEREMDRQADEIARAQDDREDWLKRTNVLEKQQSQVDSLVARRDLTKETLAELKAIYDRFANEAKERLAEKSTEIFTRLADEGTQKDIKKISIDESYMLDVLNWTGQRRLGEISAGQRQIVSLSFIMALIQVAGNLEVALFMDTPFGRLSGVHRDHLLDTIPKMASQWILLATDTEFTEVEANALRQTNAWGKIYELVKEGEGITQIVEREVHQFTPKRKSIF